MNRAEKEKYSVWNNYTNMQLISELWDHITHQRSSATESSASVQACDNGIQVSWGWEDLPLRLGGSLLLLSMQSIKGWVLKGRPKHCHSEWTSPSPKAKQFIGWAEMLFYDFLFFYAFTVISFFFYCSLASFELITYLVLSIKLVNQLFFKENCVISSVFSAVLTPIYDSKLNIWKNHLGKHW